MTKLLQLVAAASALVVAASTASSIATGDGGYFTLVGDVTDAANLGVLRTTESPATSPTFSTDRTVLAVAFLSDTPFVNNTQPFHRNNEWPTFDVTPSRSLLASAPTQAYYAAGYLEGYSTYFDIYCTWQSYADPLIVKTYQKVWVREHLDYLARLITPWCDAATGFTCSFTDSEGNTASEQVKYVARALAQFRGMVAGYQARLVEEDLGYFFLSEFQMFWLAFWPEMQSIFAINKPNSTAKPPKYPSRQQLPYFAPEAVTIVSLSAQDMFVGHNLIDTYSRMIRVVKSYHFETTVTMTATPGMWGSGDDFIVTSEALVILSTPLLFTPAAPARTLVPSSAVLRGMTALQLAFTSTNASYFVEAFAAADATSTGTHVSQWLVLDLEEMSVPGEGAPSDVTELALKTGAAFVVETLPLGVESPTAEVTNAIVSQGNWIATGIGYFTESRDATGQTVSGGQCQYGGFYDVTKNPRFRIASNLLQKFTTPSLSGFQSLMRTNDYHTDSLAIPASCTQATQSTACNQVNCAGFSHSAQLAIAPRGDLVSEVAEYATLSQLEILTTGAVDSKVLSVAQMVGSGYLSSQWPRPIVGTVSFNTVLGPPWSANSAAALPALNWYEANSAMLLLSHIGQTTHLVEYPWRQTNATMMPQTVPNDAVNVQANSGRGLGTGLLIAMVAVSATVVIGLFIAEVYQRQTVKAKKQATTPTPVEAAADSAAAVAADLKQRLTASSTEQTSLLGR